MDKQKFVGVIIFFEQNSNRKYLFSYDFENDWWTFYSVGIKDFKGEFNVISNQIRDLGLTGDFINYKDYLEIAPYGEIQQEVHLFLFKSDKATEIPDFKWMSFEEAKRKLLLSDFKEVLTRVNHVLDSRIV